MVRPAVRVSLALLRIAIGIALAAIGLVLIAAGALIGLARRNRAGARPRLLWGTRPIKSLTYMSRAMRAAGYESDTVALELYPIVDPADFDHLPFAKRGSVMWRYAAGTLAAYWFFARALTRYHVFHYFFDGGVLRKTILWRIEFPVLKRLGKKLILMPYGGDSFVTDTIANVLWRHGLLIDYPQLGNDARRIERQVRRGTRHADVVVASLTHIACLPRWDILPLIYYPIDTDGLEPCLPGTEGPVRIAHAANHRGFKGTEFVIDAVERLRRDGVDVQFDLIERRPNDEALRIISECDIYVDQLIAAYALAAIEGMALGKVVLSPIEGTWYTLFRRYSYLDECPIVPATPETVYEVLSDLLARRDDWPDIGRRSRDFVERRHSFGAAQEMWEAIYRRVWHGENVDLINFYHPIIGTSQR
jgi:glycosyltransferase involved in cell wall biosynthesis